MAVAATLVRKVPSDPAAEQARSVKYRSLIAMASEAAIKERRLEVQVGGWRPGGIVASRSNGCGSKFDQGGMFTGGGGHIEARGGEIGSSGNGTSTSSLSYSAGAMDRRGGTDDGKLKRQGSLSTMSYSMSGGDQRGGDDNKLKRQGSLAAMPPYLTMGGDQRGGDDGKLKRQSSYNVMSSSTPSPPSSSSSTPSAQQSSCCCGAAAASSVGALASSASGGGCRPGDSGSLPLSSSHSNRSRRSLPPGIATPSPSSFGRGEEQESSMADGFGQGGKGAGEKLSSCEKQHQRSLSDESVQINVGRGDGEDDEDDEYDDATTISAASSGDHGHHRRHHSTSAQWSFGQDEVILGVDVQQQQAQLRHHSQLPQHNQQLRKTSSARVCGSQQRKAMPVPMDTDVMVNGRRRVAPPMDGTIDGGRRRFQGGGECSSRKWPAIEVVGSGGVGRRPYMTMMESQQQQQQQQQYSSSQNQMHHQRRQSWSQASRGVIAGGFDYDFPPLHHQGSSRNLFAGGSRFERSERQYNSRDLERERRMAAMRAAAYHAAEEPLDGHLSPRVQRRWSLNSAATNPREARVVTRRVVQSARHTPREETTRVYRRYVDAKDDSVSFSSQRKGSAFIHQQYCSAASVLAAEITSKCVVSVVSKSPPSVGNSEGSGMACDTPPGSPPPPGFAPPGIAPPVERPSSALSLGPPALKVVYHEECEEKGFMCSGLGLNSALKDSSTQKGEKIKSSSELGVEPKKKAGAPTAHAQENAVHAEDSTLSAESLEEDAEEEEEVPAPASAPIGAPANASSTRVNGTSAPTSGAPRSAVIAVPVVGTEAVAGKPTTQEWQLVEQIQSLMSEKTKVIKEKSERERAIQRLEEQVNYLEEEMMELEAENLRKQEQLEEYKEYMKKIGDPNNLDKLQRLLSLIQESGLNYHDCESKLVDTFSGLTGTSMRSVDSGSVQYNEDDDLSIEDYEMPYDGAENYESEVEGSEDIRSTIKSSSRIDTSAWNLKEVARPLPSPPSPPSPPSSPPPPPPPPPSAAPIRTTPGKLNVTAFVKVDEDACERTKKSQCKKVPEKEKNSGSSGSVLMRVGPEYRR